MKEVEPEKLFLIIFHYGLEHGLQFESYLKLIIKSNCWLNYKWKKGNTDIGIMYPSGATQGRP